MRVIHAHMKMAMLVNKDVLLPELIMHCMPTLMLLLFRYVVCAMPKVSRVILKMAPFPFEISARGNDGNGGRCYRSRI